MRLLTSLIKQQAFSFFCLLMIWTDGSAQFNVSGEMMQRSEFRNGYGNLSQKDSAPAFFIGSRTRLQCGHHTRAVQFFASVQDVRTFGSGPGRSSEPSLSLYEGWIQVRLDSGLQLKIGRQEMNYDNARFLGNVDWALGGRSHDFVLLRFDRGKIKTDAGFAYNQDGEKLTGNIYTNNNYKSAQFFRGEYKNGVFEAAALFWNEGRQYVVVDGYGKITKQGTRYLQTAGIPLMKMISGNTTLSGFGYYQFGLDNKGRKTEAYDISAAIFRQVNLNEGKQRHLLIGIGAEVISGSADNNSSINRSFSLLHGTNHALNGYMDYFFVGGRHQNSVGLIDTYFKTKFEVGKSFFCLISIHYFQSQAGINGTNGENMARGLGTETDFTAGIRLFDNFSLQGGYSQMFASPSLAYLRGMTFVSNSQNWAYLMVLYRPNGKKPFVGIVF